MLFGGYEWVLIALVIFLFFGAKRIPNFIRNRGQGIKELNRARGEIKEEFDKEQQDFSEASKKNPK